MSTQRYAVTAKGPRPVDVHVGGRMRLRRTMLGMSQEKLGREIGLTFQQVQKYERGANRIGASRLYHLAHVLDVPVSFFFDDMPEAVRLEPTRAASGDGAGDLRLLHKRETLELMRAYARLPDDARAAVFRLVKVMSHDCPAAPG